MSLNFYADPGLTLLLTAASPKRFLFSNAGEIKHSQVWLGDPYTSTCSAEALAGATSISLTNTGEFLNASQVAATSGGKATAVASIDTFPFSVQFTYTGKTQSSLTGVLGLTSNILAGAKVHPYTVYHGVGSNISVVPSGADLLNHNIRIAVGTSPTLSFPGLPAIFGQSTIAIGVANAIEVFLSVTAPAGADREFFDFGIQANNLYIRDFADTTAHTSSESTVAPVATMYGYRHDQWLSAPIRVLPVNRQVNPNSPGFIVGDYRWRSESNSNATALVPTTWKNTPSEVGLEKFVAGIGDQSDLSPVNLEEENNSIHIVINDGEYFTGANRYYLPANPVLEFVQTNAAAADINGAITWELQGTPESLKPIFVGTYIRDSQGFYETDLSYRYIGTIHNPDGSLRTDLPDNYFTVDIRNKKITLNKSMITQLMFLGTVSGQPIDYFDLPIYPVDGIITVYIDRGPDEPLLFSTDWDYDQDAGTIQVPNIAGSLNGQGIFASASPAVAVLYDTGPNTIREIETVDLNPAFSGLAGGYFYLQHRKQTPAFLVLSCDKPRIDIPATQASIIGLVAYGPVYFQNDYALLTVTAFGSLNNERVPNALLNVVVDPSTFTGTINYVDPLTTPVQVVTGGDGTANLIFVPKNGFGIYIPTIAAAGGLGGVATTHITGDTLVLPVDVALSQIWNVQEGWLVTTYSVINNDPLFGMVGGIPSLGEIPWQTVGIPGAPNYKTNGELDAWYTGGGRFGNLVVPIDAVDVGGHSYTSSSFNGNVRRLVYSQPLPTGGSLGDVGAYFITFIQRVLIRMQLENSDIFSNLILLQMQAPTLIVDNPWLILNDTVQGLLNQFRLGFVPGAR